MESIFQNTLGDPEAPVLEDDRDDDYVNTIKTLIDDAVDYEESELSPARETLTKYYYGHEPALHVEEGEEQPQQSTIVSTDVRDTVMSIMPSLMRIFAGSEHIVNFMPNTAEQVDMARQQTDYIRYKFWEENHGFMVLHSAIKDCLTVKLGVVTWWSDTSYEPAEISFSNVHIQQIALAMEEAAESDPQIVEMSQPNQGGIVEKVTIRYMKSKPSLVIRNVPPEEFRISRNAKDVYTADCTGWERYERASNLVAMGYDKEVVDQFKGQVGWFSEERDLRNPGSDTSTGLDDMVLYGEFFIRVDEDGDGVNELHKICTMGTDHKIVDDFIVSAPKFALFQSDPRPHTAIGDCPADLVMDIQAIKTAVLRGSLDSLADTLNPRTAVNEMLTNIDDVLNTDRGAVIRTKTAPSEAVHELRKEFVGAYGFEMMAQLDAVRQSRTGISEASKGLDPKVFQSTNLAGIDIVANGAQERIELIARIIAETGIRDLYKGLLQEVVDNPNPQEVVQISGNFIPVNPSLFDASMRCSVNPMLSKGSDATRLQALENILEKQVAVVERFGIDNPIVSITELRNTMVDMLAIVNIKDVERYFRQVTPEILRQIAETPKEPDPATLLAQAEMEKVKKDMVLGQDKANREDLRLQMEDDFRRDKLNIDSYIGLLEIIKDIAQADTKHPDLENKNEPI